MVNENTKFEEIDLSKKFFMINGGYNEIKRYVQKFNVWYTHDKDHITNIWDKWYGSVGDYCLFFMSNSKRFVYITKITGINKKIEEYPDLTKIPYYIEHKQNYCIRVEIIKEIDTKINKDNFNLLSVFSEIENMSTESFETSLPSSLLSKSERPISNKNDIKWIIENSSYQKQDINQISNESINNKILEIVKQFGFYTQIFPEKFFYENEVQNELARWLSRGLIEEIKTNELSIKIQCGDNSNKNRYDIGIYTKDDDFVCVINIKTSRPNSNLISIKKSIIEDCKKLGGNDTDIVLYIGSHNIHSNLEFEEIKNEIKSTYKNITFLYFQRYKLIEIENIYSINFKD